MTEKTYPASGWNYVQEFSRQHYPVTIIAGDHDFVDLGNALAKKWVKEVPHIQLIIINRAGHILWLDQPADFEKQLTSVLKK